MPIGLLIILHIRILIGLLINLPVRSFPLTFLLTGNTIWLLKGKLIVNLRPRKDTMDIQIPKLTCNKCDHLWIPRQADVRVCPKCKTTYWEKPKEAEEGVREI